MNKFFRLIFFTTGAFVLFSARLHAQDGKAGQDIPCPVPEVRAEITTALPAPWWNTPQVGGVMSVHVDQVGGKKVLMCEYQAYGRTIPVMREMPPGVADCSPKDKGFVCR